MTVIDLEDAKRVLEELVRRVRHGEEVVLTDHGNAVARLLAVEAAKGRRLPGDLKGKVAITDEFDAPLPVELVQAFCEAPLLPPEGDEVQ